MRIYIVTPTHVRVPLKVHKFETIGIVKNKINHKGFEKGLITERLQFALYFNGAETSLHDHHTLSYYKIKDGDDVLIWRCRVETDYVCHD